MSSIDGEISAVIIGLNEERYIGECIDAFIRHQTPKVSRIIYVDSGSTDNTLKIVQGKPVDIIRIENPFRSPGYARNIGLDQVDTEFVIFLDGDMVLCDGFLEPAMACFRDRNVACVSGAISERFPLKNIYHRGLSVDWTERRTGRAVTPSGGGVFRVCSLREVGGYNDEIPAAEEIDLKNRLVEKGYALVAVDRVMAEHDLDMNGISDLVRRAQREGRLQAYALMHPEKKSISNYRRLAIKNDIAFLVVLVLLLTIAANDSWAILGWGIIVGILLFSARFFREIRSSHDPLGRLLNLLFIYFKRPFQVMAQVKHLLDCRQRKGV